MWLSFPFEQGLNTMHHRVHRTAGFTVQCNILKVSRFGCGRSSIDYNKFTKFWINCYIC